MSRDVIMPALGMAQKTSLIVRWLKQAGDQVKKGDILMEVETDKAVMEVEADADGTLTDVSAGAGEEVPVGEMIARIANLAVAAAAPAARAPAAPPPVKSAAPKGARPPLRLLRHQWQRCLRVPRTDAYSLRPERAGLRRRRT